MAQSTSNRDMVESTQTGIIGLPDKLRPSDQLRIFAGYHSDKLPQDAVNELCELADDWDEEVASVAGRAE